jgi:hypothetical protein
MIASNKIVIFLIVCLAASLAAPFRAAAQAPVAEQPPVAQQPPPGAEDQLPYKYTANLYSRKFHRPRCPYSRMMAESKKVRFHFRYQAVTQGYVPCRYCLPAVWTTVRATIRCQDLDKIAPDKNTLEQKTLDQNAVDHDALDKEALDKNTSDKNGIPKDTLDKDALDKTPSNSQNDASLGTTVERPNISSQ